MRDLPPMSRILGHPLIAVPLTGGLALGFLALVQTGPGGIFPALLLLIPAAWVARSVEAVHRQRQWRRAWDSMAEPYQPQPVGWGRKALGCLLVAGVTFYLAANADEPDNALALGWMVLVATVSAVVMAGRTIIRRSRNKRAKRVQDPVATIAVRGPVLPVPDLMDAYRALPPHCHGGSGR